MRFSQASLLPKLDPNSSMSKKLQPSFMVRTGQHSFQGLKGEFDEPTCPLTSQLSDSLFFLYMKRNKMPLDHNWPIWYYSQQLDPVAWECPPCLKAIMATVLLVKTTEKIIVGSPLTIFPSHMVKALLNSYHTQLFSTFCLTTYEVFVKCSSHNSFML